MNFDLKDFDNLFNLSQQGVLLIDVLGKISAANNAFCSLVGCHKFEIINNKLSKFVSDDFVSSCNINNTDLFEYLNSAKNLNFNLITINKNHVNVNCKTQFIQFDGNNYLLTYLCNNTELLKQKEETDLLQKKLREYAFLTSHKLRHPIANILGLVELLNVIDSPNLDNRIVVENIATSAIQLNEVILELNVILNRDNIPGEIELFNQPILVNSVMLVDDDLINNYVNKTLINKCNSKIKVIDMISGKAALEFLQQNQNMPDLIFLDLNMPILSGWSFLTEFKKLNLKIKIYILTTSIESENIAKANAFGLDIDFIEKPLTLNVLRKLL